MQTQGLSGGVAATCLSALGFCPSFGSQQLDSSLKWTFPALQRRVWLTASFYTDSLWRKIPCLNMDGCWAPLLQSCRAAVALKSKNQSNSISEARFVAGGDVFY